MKTCATCQEKKELDQFSKNATRSDGLSGHCKTCHKKFRRKHYEENKKKIIGQVALKNKEYKEWYNSLKQKPCMDCGVEYPPYVMDFDHREDKKLSICGAKQHGLAKRKILEEITKCDLVCSNCHRLRTHNRNALLA